MSSSASAALPAVILFDVDGTLIDTHRLYMEAYRRALSGHLGYSPTDEEIINRAPASERRMLEEWVGPERGSLCHADLCRHYESLHATLCEGMYEGIREMLAGLRSAGLPLGVVTGKGRRAWEVTTAAMELGAFDVVVTDDDMDHPKPHPFGLLTAARALGVDPSLVAYIGDSAADIEAGRRAGMSVGAVLWPKREGEEREGFLNQIGKHAPDWVFERPSDVVRAFAAWC